MDEENSSLTTRCGSKKFSSQFLRVCIDKLHLATCVLHSLLYTHNQMKLLLHIVDTSHLQVMCLTYGYINFATLSL